MSIILRSRILTIITITTSKASNQSKQDAFVAQQPQTRRSTMKKMISAATITFACLSAITVGFAGSPIGSRAVAAEASCAFLSGSTTTGGSVREQLDAIAHCHTPSQPSVGAQPSLQPATKMTAIQIPSNAVRSSNQSSHYPAYCNPLPAGVNPGDFAFREALQQCKYGL